MKKKISKILRPVFLCVGLLLLIVLIKKIGLDRIGPDEAQRLAILSTFQREWYFFKTGIWTIGANISEIGWYFIPILCVSFAWYMLYTTAWMQFLHRIGEGIGFWELFRIKITGEAVNTLTPANFIGGDPMRIYLLRKNFKVAEGAASVVVDRTLQSTATLFVIIMGITAAFFTFEVLPMNIKFGVPIVLAVSIGFIAFILIHQRKGIFGLILKVCKKIGLKKEFSEKTISRFEELDSHIMDFYDENHKGFLIALLCHIVGRLFGIIEIYAIGRVVSDDFTLFAALILTALAPMVNIVFAFVPGAFGVMEGAYSGVLYLLHMDPAIGITIQIAKRLRAGAWILLGLIFLGAHDRKKVWEEEQLIEEV